MGIREILEGVDIHEVNRQKFRLPTRLIAKTFIFRLLFGGTEWSYAQDPEFTSTSTKPKFWRGVIDEFYAKYGGLRKWHDCLVDRAISEGSLTVPSGRKYNFTPYRDKRGEIKWPRTTILNYPVQGFSADLMAIARVSTFNRLRKYRPKVLMVNTVHDDIELDITEDMCYTVCSEMERVFLDIPMNFERLYGVKFNVPLVGEISYGDNLASMKEFNSGLGIGQFINV